MFTADWSLVTSFGNFIPPFEETLTTYCNMNDENYNDECLGVPYNFQTMNCKSTCRKTMGFKYISKKLSNYCQTENMESKTQEEDTKTSGDIYLKNADKNSYDKLNATKALNVFIIQRKSTVDYFSGNVIYEIMDTRKNILFKASKSRSFRAKKPCKLILRNLRNVKVLSVVVDSTNNSGLTEPEATVYIYPTKQKVAHVAKYGGTLGAPCFEVLNVDRKSAFTIDLSTKKSSNSVLEYEVSAKKRVVANIMAKTGLNYILSTDVDLQTIEKSTLIAVTLAMDMLKTGRDNQKAVHSDSAATGSASNQYLFN